MSTPSTRAALRELDAARPAITRLGTTQGSEDRAADLIEGWSAVETALRSLVGGSSLAGKPLIHELRARQVISFDQANALADFHSAAERARRTDYTPDGADVEAARQGFAKLETGLSAADTAPVPPAGYAAAAAAAPVTEPVVPPPGVVVTPVRRARPAWLVPVLALLLLAVALGAWYMFGGNGGEKSLNEAVTLYHNGQREQAVAAFERAARENPNDARPHMYLSRMAREVGNLTLARDEATKAIRADTSYALAYREMGAVLFTIGRADLAKNFYVRAIERDGQDKVAMGYLACTLVKLGQYDQAQKFKQRAGSGDWDRCAQLPPPGYAPQPYPPAGYQPNPPQGYPPQGYPQQPPPAYPQQQVPRP